MQIVQNGLSPTSRYELDGFLKVHDIWIEYTMDDFRREVLEMKSLPRFS
jgi:hypothetical protein